MVWGTGKLKGKKNHMDIFKQTTKWWPHFLSLIADMCFYMLDHNKFTHAKESMVWDII